LWRLLHLGALHDAPPSRGPAAEARVEALHPAGVVHRSRHLAIQGADMTAQRLSNADDTAIREVEHRQRRLFRLPTLGIFEAMKVTLRTMLSKAVTVQYPEERIELPERTRGVIALL